MKKPWGWMITFLHTPKFWLKLLRVKGRTSYQYHDNRTEWVLGLYKVKRGEKHRMQHGWYVELATGEPDENDIHRIEDDYARG